MNQVMMRIISFSKKSLRQHNWPRRRLRKRKQLGRQVRSKPKHRKALRLSKAKTHRFLIWKLSWRLRESRRHLPISKKKPKSRNWERNRNRKQQKWPDKNSLQKWIRNLRQSSKRKGRKKKRPTLNREKLMLRHMHNKWLRTTREMESTEGNPTLQS